MTMDADDGNETGGFKLPALDEFDDLPLPNIASDGGVSEASDDSELRDPPSGMLPAVEDLVSEAEVAHDSDSSDDEVDDSDLLSSGPPAPVDVEEDDELEDEALLSDDAALRAVFRAQAGNGGEIPEGFNVTDEPSLADLFDLDLVLEQAIDFGASDVHISPDNYVAFTRLGEIVRQPEFGRVTGAITESVQTAILTHQLEAGFVEDLELDTSYVIHGGRYDQRRFRLSVGRTLGDIFFVFRVISDNIPTPEDLGVSETLRAWSTLPNGLVMMNGPTGTGKSTTLASLLNAAILERPQKIITIERPIEYLFTDAGRGFVTQREVGQDTRQFATALDSAMRQAPDIIMIGESRNRTEIDQVLRAAETGHLALTTMHTNSAAATLNRIKSLFDGSEQNRVLSTLADVSRGFANQVLVKTIDGESRFAIRELLEFNDEVSDLVTQGDIKGIRRYQMENHLTMEDGLVKAVVDGRCTVEAARAQSAYPLAFNKMLAELG